MQTDIYCRGPHRVRLGVYEQSGDDFEGRLGAPVPDRLSRGGFVVTGVSRQLAAVMVGQGAATGTRGTHSGSLGGEACQCAETSQAQAAEEGSSGVCQAACRA